MSALNIDKNFFIPKTVEVNFLYEDVYSEEKNCFVQEESKKSLINYIDEKNRTFDIDESKVYKKKDFDNVPQKGFSINKNTYSVHDYSSYVDGVTIYDPRGFEFTISIQNFLRIVRENVIDHGELIGEFIISFSLKGKIVLLSVDSEGYKKAVSYTEKQSFVFDPENLKEGATYFIKKSKDPLVYMGKKKINNLKNRDCFQMGHDLSLKIPSKVSSVFYNRETENFISLQVSKNLAGILDEEVCDDFEKLMLDYKNSSVGKVIERIDFNKATLEDLSKVDNKTVFGAVLCDDCVYIINNVYVGFGRGVMASLSTSSFKNEGSKGLTTEYTSSLNLPINNLTIKEAKRLGDEKALEYYLNQLLEKGMLSIMTISFLEQ